MHTEGCIAALHSAAQLLHEERNQKEINLGYYIHAVLSHPPPPPKFFNVFSAKFYENISQLLWERDGQVLSVDSHVRQVS